MTEAGIFRVEPSVYRADTFRDVPTLSSTLARIILTRSPRHAWAEHPRLNPEWRPTDSTAFDIGRAAHRAVLGFGDEYVPIPEDLLDVRGGATTKAARAFIEEIRAAGATPLKPAEWEAVERMATAVGERLALMGIHFDPARSEITALAEVDGVWCRAMVDNAPKAGALYDLKTCEDASPDALVRSVLRYGYDVQAAHYLDTWEAATGEQRRFRFVFVEKKPPHEISVVELCDDPDDEGDWMETARSKAREARRRWKRCLETGEWPGYPPCVGILTAPVWYAASWADQDLGDFAPPPPSSSERKPDKASLRAAYEMQAP